MSCLSTLASSLIFSSASSFDWMGFLSGSGKTGLTSPEDILCLFPSGVRSEEELDPVS